MRELSQGEQTLLSIAPLLATGAKLLLDEPASGLSAGAFDAVMALLRRLRAEGKTLPWWSTTRSSCRRSPTTCWSCTRGRLMAQARPTG